MGVAAEVVELFRIVAEGPEHGDLVVDGGARSRRQAYWAICSTSSDSPGMGEQENKARIE